MGQVKKNYNKTLSKLLLGLVFNGKFSSAPGLGDAVILQSQWLRISKPESGRLPFLHVSGLEIKLSEEPEYQVPPLQTPESTKLFPKHPEQIEGWVYRSQLKKWDCLATANKKIQFIDVYKVTF